MLASPFRRPMVSDLIEAEPFEERFDVKCEDFPSTLSGKELFENCNQPADDVGIAVGDEIDAVFGPRTFRMANK